MCGINGIIDFKGIYRQEERHNIVHEMNEKIIYRGPNSEGIYDSSVVTMGMRRLSIIDLSTGNQPIYNEDKSIAIVFNGEIYNFKELRSQLIEKGHRFSTKTDTEVIVHAYEEYGLEAFRKLDGMFAISLYDANQNCVYVARDRMGEKPCYYYTDDNMFCYASELKSIIALPFVKKEMDKKALNLYLQLTYIPSPLTIYKDINKVMPGHVLKISLSGNVEDICYWDIKECLQNNCVIDYQKAQKQLYSIMNKSVKERMVSDVPLGAFLSGGIDSSIIVGLMSKNSKVPIETFTIGFQEKEYDERDRARMVAEYYKTNHHEYVLDYKEALSIIDGILDKLDEPFGDSSILPTFFVSRFASENVKVVLTGDAGDELFLGYSKYLIGYYSKIYKKIPKLFRKNIIEPIIYSMNDSTVISRKLRKVIDNVDSDCFEQRLALMSMGFKTYERKQLLKEEFIDDSGIEHIKDIYDSIDNANELVRTQCVDLQIVLEGDMMTKVDRMSMLNSLETRTPMLAREVVNFACGIPVDYKLKNKDLKRILKDTFSDILPNDFTKFPKSGFAVPLDYWFRSELKSELLEMFSKETIERQGIFEYSYIDKILQEHFQQKKNRKNEIWTLYVFQKWFNNIEKLCV